VLTLRGPGGYEKVVRTGFRDSVDRCTVAVRKK
jgi:hypothetical protein